MFDKKSNKYTTQRPFSHVVIECGVADTVLHACTGQNFVVASNVGIAL